MPVIVVLVEEDLAEERTGLFYRLLGLPLVGDAGVVGGGDVGGGEGLARAQQVYAEATV